MKILFCFVTLLLTSQFAFSQWVRQTVNTTSSFRGLAVVNERVIWASGTGGTVIRTINGGNTWKVMTIPGAEKLDFRDIEAFDSYTAYILSIGNGEQSRIYKTSDGGETWKEQFRNTIEKAFFDAVACWDANNCIAMSDPVDGHYLLIKTIDGKTWKPIVSKQLPAAKDGEAAFAASGTCLVTHGKKSAFLVSGGNDARVFRSNDRGSTWSVAETPISGGTPGSGIFSIAMRGSRQGVIVGGNYEKADENKNILAFTRDGGRTWYPANGLRGYRSGVAYLNKSTIVAVGTNGSDLTLDGGKTWKVFGTYNLNVVQSDGNGIFWAAGPGGLVLRSFIGTITKD